MEDDDDKVENFEGNSCPQSACGNSTTYDSQSINNWEQPEEIIDEQSGRVVRYQKNRHYPKIVKIISNQNPNTFETEMSP